MNIGRAREKRRKFASGSKEKYSVPPLGGRERCVSGLSHHIQFSIIFEFLPFPPTFLQPVQADNITSCCGDAAGEACWPGASSRRSKSPRLPLPHLQPILTASPSAPYHQQLSLNTLFPPYPYYLPIVSPSPFQTRASYYHHPVPIPTILVLFHSTSVYRCIISSLFSPCLNHPFFCFSFLPPPLLLSSPFFSLSGLLSFFSPYPRLYPVLTPTSILTLLSPHSHPQEYHFFSFLSLLSRCYFFFISSWFLHSYFFLKIRLPLPFLLRNRE